MEIIEKYVIADSKKTATAFIKKTVTKNDYDRGYERGYSDCFPKGYAAGLKVKSPKK